MHKKRKIQLMFAALVLVAMACLSSPTNLIQDRAQEAFEDIGGTIEAETGFDLEEIQSTVEAEIEEMDLKGIKDTAQAELEDIDLQELKETADAALEGNLEIGDDVETDFPIPDGAKSVILIAGALNFTTDLSIDDAVEFYRNEFAALGLSERTLTTVIEGSTASLVFDGHESGDAIVVQMVDLDILGTNVNVRFEDL